MQQAIAEAAMAGKHVLGILPTGTGKSLCYQIPALSRYDKTGSLTVVISPLVALMADQVAGLESAGDRARCVTINGLLSMPERADALDRVRLGRRRHSPRSRRSNFAAVLCAGFWTSVRSVAGCLTKPTACRAGATTSAPTTAMSSRFIREKAAPMSRCRRCCALTATAKPDVTRGHRRATSATNSASSSRSSTAVPSAAT